MRKLLILVALIALTGCDSVPTTPVSSSSSKRGTLADGIASYDFHSKLALAEVTKTLPEGSVDYIDLDMAEHPNVLVVVTATAPPQDGLTFTTAFSGYGNLTIEKQWAPSTSKGDNEHVGIFVLPKSINSGRTFRSRSAAVASFEDADITF